MSNTDKEWYLQDPDPEKAYRKKSSNIPRSFFICKWTDYNINNKGDGKQLPDYVVKSRLKARNECRDYALRIKEICNDCTGDSLLILGSSGTGKSTLSCLILREVIRTNAESVYYKKFTEMSMKIQYSWKDFQEEAFEKEYIIDPTFLVIDEINESCFPERYRDKIQQHLNYVITTRYSNRQPTILTSNIMNPNIFKKMVGDDTYDTLYKGDQYKVVKIINSKDEDNDIQIDLPDMRIDLNEFKKEADIFLRKQKQIRQNFKSPDQIGEVDRITLGSCDSDGLIEIIKKARIK